MANHRDSNVLSDNNLTDNDDIGPLITQSCYYDIDEFNELCESYDNTNNITVLNLNSPFSRQPKWAWQSHSG